jgi:dolichyl-phosphate-mannose-protein mannosyltransferase
VKNPSHLSSDRPTPIWNRIDTASLFLITLAAAAIRLPRLSSPATVVTDEYVYVPQACAYIRGLRACGLSGHLYELHPPLGKWLIGFGIRVFGDNPAGWRAASLVAGTLTVGLLYVLGRLTLRSTFGAIIASSALAVDFLHFVNSRIGMLDIFLTLFLVAAFLFLVLDRRSANVSRRGERPYARPWQLACGVSLGAAIATKWIGVAALAVILMVALAGDIRRTDLAGRKAQPWYKLFGPTTLYLIAVPAIVYLMSYVGRIDGAVFAWPWSSGSWPRRFIGQQINTMLLGHVELRGISHTYGAPPWSWPLLKRPFVYYFEETSGGMYREILGVGNPILWWPALAAVIGVAARWFRRRRFEGLEVVILGGFAAAYGAWFLFGLVRTGGFSFYMLPAVPFMYLALGWAAIRVTRTLAVSLTALLALATIALFLFYYPLLTAMPISYSAWEQRILLRGCEPADTQTMEASNNRTTTSRETPFGREQPDIRTGPPPIGWCWV